MIIRNILGVPSSYRAAQKGRQAKKPSVPPQVLQERVEYLRSLGVQAELKYCRQSGSYYVSYREPAVNW